MKRRRPHAFIRSVHRRIDDVVAKLAVVARGQGAPFACRAGCAWCCAEPVYAIRAEAELAADRVRAMPPAERARIEAAVYDSALRFLASPLARQEQPDVVAYRRLRLVCPLLGPDNRCTVYADRPMGCRMHLARKPAEPFCADDEARRSQQFVASGMYAWPAVASVALNDEGSYDHFLVLLANALGGTAWTTGAFQRVEPGQVPPFAKR